MLKETFLIVLCTLTFPIHSTAWEMKTGDERQTLEEITRTSWTQSDQKLNENVRTSLKEDVSLRKFLTDVQLKTAGNIVYIRGTVESEKQKRAIEDRVRSHPGVSEFRSYIKVVEN